MNVFSPLFELFYSFDDANDIFYCYHLQIKLFIIVFLIGLTWRTTYIPSNLLLYLTP